MSVILDDPEMMSTKDRGVRRGRPVVHSFPGQSPKEESTRVTQRGKTRTAGSGDKTPAGDRGGDRKRGKPGKVRKGDRPAPRDGDPGAGRGGRRGVGVQPPPTAGVAPAITAAVDNTQRKLVIDQAVVMATELAREGKMDVRTYNAHILAFAS